MRIGLIGDGGREHALAQGVCANPDSNLFVAAKNRNQGIVELAKDYSQLGFDDLNAIRDYFIENAINLVVVGPEATLMNGIVDLHRKSGIPIVGPTRKQALLEGDKSFMRRLLRDKLGWGSPEWRTASTLDEAEDFIITTGDIVVKPLGLTGGKGVRVMGIQLKNQTDTLAYIAELIEKDGQVLLEEKIIGEEFSRMAFVSDGVLVPIPLMQDFKYAFDGDQGLMTGGMGAYSFADGSLPFVQEEELALADQLLSEVITAIEEETDSTYRGFLYGQFMVSKKGVRLIEFNVRLGDPEALNVMAILASDAVDLFMAIGTGSLKNYAVLFHPAASVSKYLVPKDYPGDNVSQPEFSLVQAAVNNAGLNLIQASMEKTGTDRWRALGSRTFGLVGTGDHPGEVSERIENFLVEHPIPELRHRKDVGNHRIIDEKISRMAGIRQLA